MRIGEFVIVLGLILLIVLGLTGAGMLEFEGMLPWKI